MIRAGVGVSTEPRSVRAAAEAVERARDSLAGEPPDFCIAFATGDHGETLPSLLQTLASAAETPYVAGCSAAGVIAEGREIEDGPAIGVLAVASDTLKATPFVFRDAGDRGLTAGVRLGQRLMNSRGTRDLVLVWPDPHRVHPDRFLQGLDATLGGVPVVGGAASSSDAGATFQFSGNDHAEGAVSGVRLGGDFQHRLAVSQGCRPVGAPLRVTRSHENLILELDGRPALERLRDVLPQDLLDDPDHALNVVSVALLPDPQDAVLRPGEYLVRNIVAADPDTGVLGIADVVEEGQTIVFALREPAAARDDLVRAVSRLAGDRPALDYKFGLYFNCLARGRALYRKEGVDAALIALALPEIPILGFFCNAEIGPVRGVNHLLTYSGVLLLVAE